MRFLLVAVLWACGSDTNPGPANAGPSTSAPAAAASLEDVSLRWAKAAFGGSRDEAIALSLTHAQLMAITTKEIEKVEYDDELGRFLDGLQRESKENPGSKVTKTRIVEKRPLSVGDKRQQAVEIGVVYFTVEGSDGQPHESILPMFFIRTDVGWRFSPKK